MPSHSPQASHFWNREYKKGGHLKLSNDPSEDLLKFLRWLGRNASHFTLDSSSFVLDIGCGNGRNLIYLAKTFGVRGIGYDSSREALDQAAALAQSEGIPMGQLNWHRHDMAEQIPCPDQSVHLALDMMASHVLDEAGRTNLRNELQRIMTPGGWIFFKTFLKDGDTHAARMLRHAPGEEKNTYIHPRIGVAEHVWTEAEMREHFSLERGFRVEKIEKSHKHMIKGRPFKRRFMSVYIEREWK